MSPYENAVTSEQARKIISELKRNKGITVVEEEKKEEQKEQQQQPQKQSSQQKAITYAQLQAQLNNQVAQLQNDRMTEIAKLAKKDRHIIYKFPDTKEPPKLGEKRVKSDYMAPIEVIYSELDNDLHKAFTDKRARIDDLKSIKVKMSASVDGNGNVIPATFIQNNPEKTGISEYVFLNINSEIEKLEYELFEEMALWFYGIPKELLPKLENTTLQLAIEAAVLREKFGVVSLSKNSGVF